jgi:hypothetical protein
LRKRKQELQFTDKIGEETDVKAVEKGRKKHSNENKQKQDKRV